MAASQTSYTMFPRNCESKSNSDQQNTDRPRNLQRQRTMHGQIRSCQGGRREWGALGEPVEGARQMSRSDCVEASRHVEWVMAIELGEAWVAPCESCRAAVRVESYTWVGSCKVASASRACKAGRATSCEQVASKHMTQNAR